MAHGGKAQNKPSAGYLKVSSFDEDGRELLKEALPSRIGLDVAIHKAGQSVTGEMQWNLNMGTASFKGFVEAVLPATKL